MDRRAGAATRKARAASPLEGIWRRLAGLPSHLEEIFLLVLFLAFLWFVVDWAIRIAAGG